MGKALWDIFAIIGAWNVFWWCLEKITKWSLADTNVGKDSEPGK